MIKWLKEKFKTVYCEDCDNCVPSDGHEDSLIGSHGCFLRGVGNGPMCKAYPLEINCGDVDSFVKNDRRVKIIKTFRRCEGIRKNKPFPLSYCPYCFKFIPKSEKSY